MIIAQISDFHLCAPGRLLDHGIDSNAMAAAAIAHVNRLDPCPDVVVVTGDLADTGDPEEYALAKALLDQLAVPYFILPGNHDKREPLRAGFSAHDYLPAIGPLHCAIEQFPVRLIMLDSSVPGQHHGEIDAAGLLWLDKTLGADDRRPAFVFLHHHPFASGIPFLDAYGLRYAEELADVIAKHRTVERILCGHVHRAITANFAGKLAMSCPSTSSQIALRLAPDAKPASYLEPPGGLLHVLVVDGGATTHLFPIGDFGPPMAFF